MSTWESAYVANVKINIFSRVMGTINCQPEYEHYLYTLIHQLNYPQYNIKTHQKLRQDIFFHLQNINYMKSFKYYPHSYSANDG